ncbi:MAG: hypothetical protein D6731_10505 [Planctomycetota bacterium]|nr:MAG: hypothetical protein D6731_10505 [Planctomycetota bacterium]
MLVDLDEVFVRYAVEHGYVTLAQVEEARRERARCERRGRRYYLGQVLIQQRALTCDQFLEIENALEARIYECSKCKTRATRRELSAEKQRCPGCGQRVTVEGGETLSVVEILASKDPRDLTISLVAAQRADPARTRTSTRQERASARTRTSARRRARSSQRKTTRRSRRSRLNRDALQVGQEDLEGLRRFEILSELGRGGMGIVFKARQLDIDRLCALKVIKAGPEVPEVQINRFVQEGRSAARLNHPNIIRIFDCGRYRDMFFVAMEYVDGRSLAQILSEDGPLPVEKALALMSDVLAAVDYAHDHGVVHRDLKPGNILIERERGRARLIDFGLAKDAERGLGLTQEGQILGSPFYLSPEQTRGRSKDVDRRADIFALGVILYEVLTGKRPFTGRSAAEVYAKILTGRPAPPSVLRPDIDQELQEIILKALEKDPRDRFPTAADFLARLERYREAREHQKSRTKSSRRIRSVSARSSARGPSAMGRVGAPTASARRVSARADPRSGVGELREPGTRSATLVWVGLGCLLAVATGVYALSRRPNSVPREERTAATPRPESTSSPRRPDAATPSAVVSAAPPEDRRSPAERAFAHARDYERENPDDALGALGLYRDAADRGGPWARKAAEAAARLERGLATELRGLLERAQALAAEGKYGAAIAALEEGALRYEGVAGSEGLQDRALRFEQDALGAARKALDAAQAHTRAHRLEEALQVLGAYRPSGVEAADRLVEEAREDLEHLRARSAEAPAREPTPSAKDFRRQLAAARSRIAKRDYAAAERSLRKLSESPLAAKGETGEQLARARAELRLARRVVEAVRAGAGELVGKRLKLGPLRGTLSSLQNGTLELKLDAGGVVQKDLVDLDAASLAAAYSLLRVARRPEGRLAGAVFLLVEGADPAACWRALAAARKAGADLGPFAEDARRLEEEQARAAATRQSKSRREGKGDEAPLEDDGTMLSVPAGTFLMGIPVNRIEAERFDEIVGRPIRLDAFRIDRYEVTNGQYARFLAWQRRHKSKAHKYCSPLEPRSKATPDGHVPAYWEDPRFRGDAYPVVGVDWFDAYAFAAWAGKRLPTEAEWERAARGTDGRTYPWGEALEPGRCLTAHRVLTLWGRELTSETVDAFRAWLRSVERLTARVDAFPEGRSPVGAFNTSGNVAEWTADWYTRDIYQVPENPRGPASGTERVIRGGHWLSVDPRHLTTTARDKLPPLERRQWLGFRCAQDADAPPPRRLR